MENTKSAKSGKSKFKDGGNGKDEIDSKNKFNGKDKIVSRGDIGNNEVNNNELAKKKSNQKNIKVLKGIKFCCFGFSYF